MAKTNFQIFNISIHAPLTRCDDTIYVVLAISKHFNPRTSHEVRQTLSTVFSKNVRFQSTHLSRGATCQRLRICLAVRISIHAPLTRCDALRRPHCDELGRFQSTHLSRGATIKSMIGCGRRAYFNPRTSHEVRRRRSAYGRRSRIFQSTHLSRGATDYILTNLKIAVFQSTHLSRGATAAICSYLRRRAHFNPRTSHEVRLRSILLF